MYDQYKDHECSIYSLLGSEERNNLQVNILNPIDWWETAKNNYKNMLKAGFPKDLLGGIKNVATGEYYP